MNLRQFPKSDFTGLGDIMPAGVAFSNPHSGEMPHVSCRGMTNGEVDRMSYISGRARDCNRRFGFKSADPDSDPTYQALRNLALGSESVSVGNADLKREAATFHLRSGTVCFTAPVQGRVTGAVFVGNEIFVLDVPPSEKDMLKLLTNENEFSESFSQMTLRFTDSTYEDIKRLGSPTTGGCDVGLLKDSQRSTRNRLKNNLEVRILEDGLSAEPGGLFRRNTDFSGIAIWRAWV